jgi:AcrR family transcriptional regulator
MLTVCDDSVVASTPPPRRREPVQDRSRKRVERILAAAVDLLEEGGIDAVTTRSIAIRADVPVATLYQFFPNRDAILREVLTGYIARRDTECIEALAAMPMDNVSDGVHDLLRFHRDHMRAHPHMVELFYSSRAVGFMPDPHESRAVFAEFMHAALIEWKLLRADADPLVCTVVIELGDRILEMAHRAGPGGDDAMLAEGERALTTYLNRYAAPPP